LGLLSAPETLSIPAENTTLAILVKVIGYWLKVIVFGFGY
jgi:hypothetical protein